MFYKPEKLPNLMVAPNGARPMKKDHSRVPVTIDEIVQTAKACFDAGAGGIHFHLRDNDGQHILNSEMCLKAYKNFKSKYQICIYKLQLKLLVDILLKK